MADKKKKKKTARELVEIHGFDEPTDAEKEKNLAANLFLIWCDTNNG